MPLFVEYNPQYYGARHFTKDPTNQTKQQWCHQAAVMTTFSKSVDIVNDIIVKSKETAKGKLIPVACIDIAWLLAYAEIARGCRDERECGS